MAVDSLSSTFTGRVAAVNPNGLRLDGHEDWFNRSKFAPSFELPQRGETVTVSVDSKGFLRSCHPFDSQARSGQAGESNGSAPAPQTASGQTKDRTISRLAILKAAAEFGASRPDLKSGDVLKIAESWERWVNRGDEAADDLEEAF